MAHSLRPVFTGCGAARRPVILPLFPLLVAASIAGCEMLPHTDVSELAAPPQIIESSLRYKKEYVLFAGDQVEVSVWRTPEFSRTVTIGPDGTISLPLLQDVHAAGLTARELAARLKQLLSARLLKPEVTVIPTQVRMPMVYVMGDVKNPSAIPYRNAQTVLQAIGVAGGVLRTGAEADITIIRLAEDGHLKAIPIETTASGQPGPYLALGLARVEPDDVIFVPESGRSEVTRFMDDLLLKPAQLLITYRLYQQL